MGDWIDAALLPPFFLIAHGVKGPVVGADTLRPELGPEGLGDADCQDAGAEAHQGRPGSQVGRDHAPHVARG